MSRYTEGRLTFVGNVLCFVEKSPQTFEPIMTVTYWAIEKQLPKIDEYEGMLAISTDGYNGSWDITFGNGYKRTIVIAGDVKPMKTENIDIPAPKTRCETRWNYGRWEKLLKSKGWVTA